MSADLRTTYMGIELANPLVAAASPLTGTIDGLLSLQDAGASAVVLQSLFEEQIKHHELQVDSILNSINRISNTTEFNGVKLLNGTLDFTTSGVTEN